MRNVPVITTVFTSSCCVVPALHAASIALQRGKRCQVQYSQPSLHLSLDVHPFVNATPPPNVYGILSRRELLVYVELRSPPRRIYLLHSQ